MKKAVIIIYDDVPTANMENFLEAIRSNFVSKKGKSNVFIVIVESTTDPKEVFDIVEKSTNFKPDILVVSMEKFYGYFIDEGAVEWLKSQLPDVNWY